MAEFPESIIKKYTRTPGPSTELDVIMRPVLFIQYLVGQQVLDSDWSWLKFAHVHIMAASIIIYVIFGTNEVIENTADVSMQSEGYFTYIIITSLLFKFFLFVINRMDFRKAYVIAKTTLLTFINEVSEEAGTFVLNRAKFIVKMLFGVLIVPVVFYIFTAMFHYARGTRVTLSKSTSTLMPMTSPYYEIGLVLHAIFMSYAVFVVVVVDMWFVYMMFFYCVANDNLSNILSVTREEGDTDESYATKLNSALRRFYEAHVEQIRYFKILIEMYKLPALIHLCYVLVCVCLILFKLSQELNWAFISFATNTLPIIAILFAYNWYGEQVKTKAINLNMALLNFDWINMRQKDKKNFYLIVSFMNKEFGMKTTFGNELSLVTMTSVLKGSYQVFAVMKSMQN